MNIANKFTISRIILIPVFILTMLVNFKYHMEISLLIFILCSVTDYIDGYLARKLNLISDFGKFLDPLADKLLTSAAFILLVEMGKIPGWVVFVIVAREFAVTGLRGIAASHDNVIAASFYGKIKTVLQMITIIILLLNNWPFIIINLPVDQVAIYLTMIVTFLSGADYFWKSKDVILKNM